MVNAKSNRPRSLLFFILLILFSLILITINVKEKRQPWILESLVSTIVSPLQKIATSSVNSLDSAWERYFHLVEIKEENKALLGELEKMEVLKNELAEIKLENARLLNLLETKNQPEMKTMMAKIIGYDSTNWNQMVSIDKGSNDGLKRAMPVICNGGLVGKIESVSLNSSKVLLITDIRNAVDALIQESRAKGVVFGTNRNLCGMKYVSLDEKIEKGFRVISSGMGGVYPKGLLVGFVEKVEKKEVGLFHEVSVKPSVDLSHLEEVLVIVD